MWEANAIVFVFIFQLRYYANVTCFNLIYMFQLVLLDGMPKVYEKRQNITYELPFDDRK